MSNSLLCENGLTDNGLPVSHSDSWILLPSYNFAFSQALYNTEQKDNLDYILFRSVHKIKERQAESLRLKVRIEGRDTAKQQHKS